MRKAVFFDRDGTLIIDKIYLNDPDQIEYLPGVIESLKSLQDGGYDFVIVTNQSGVPRGLVTYENLHETHRRIQKKLNDQGIFPLGFYYAPHLTDSNHPWRKPSPEMLLQAARDHNIDLKQSWMIGDRMTDVEAGHRANTRSLFLTGTEEPSDSPFAPPEAVVKTLLEVADHILKSSQ